MIGLMKPISEGTCAGCGQRMMIGSGESFIASTAGEMWHIGCSPSARKASELAEAREAFLDMLADASQFVEEPDGDETGNHTRILINTHWAQFERLANAFGIRTRYMESIFEAVERTLTEEATK